MSKRLRLPSPLRIQFLITAISLAVITTVLGLSAYLTDKDTYQATFNTVGGDELGFKLTGEKHEGTAVIPGDTVTLNVVASVEKPYNLFIFVKFDIPAVFTMSGFNSAEWHPIKDGSNIYYHGNNDVCISLGTMNGNESKVLDGVTLSTDSQGGESYIVDITGYAIQANNIDASNTDPEKIFAMIGGN